MNTNNNASSNIARIFLFLILFCILFYGCTYLFKPYRSYANGEGESARAEGFYSIPRKSLDYVVVGASHTIYSINPMNIYAEAGYKGYVLGAPQQKIDLSYYWLKEMYKRQSPDVVFIDVATLNSDSMDESLIISELEEMRPSFNKLKAIYDVTNNTDTRAALLMPMSIYHTRWNALSPKERDTTFLCGSEIKFSILNDSRGFVDQKTEVKISKELDNVVINPISDRNIYYFKRIIELCHENNTKLVPVKLPTMNWNDELTDQVRVELTKLGYELWDLNNELKNTILWEVDTADSGYHTNYWGGFKTSCYIADYLTENNVFRKEGYDDFFNSLFLDYQIYEEEGLLEVMPNDYIFASFLEGVFQNNVVLLSVKGGINSAIINELKGLGLTVPKLNNFFYSYVGIYNNGATVVEKWSKNRIVFNDLISDDNGEDHNVCILSAAKMSGEMSSIEIDGEESSLNEFGINIVVCNSASFDVVLSFSYNSLTNEFKVSGKGSSIENRYLAKLDVDMAAFYPLSQDLDIGLSVDSNMNIDFSDMPTKFRLIKSSSDNNVYYIMDEISKKYIAVRTRDDYGKEELYLDNYTGLSNQKWCFLRTDSGNYRIVSLYNHLLWQIDNQNDVNEIKLSFFRNMDNQNWHLSPM